MPNPMDSVRRGVGVNVAHELYRDRIVASIRRNRQQILDLRADIDIAMPEGHPRRKAEIAFCDAALAVCDGTGTLDDLSRAYLAANGTPSIGQQEGA